MRLKLLLSMLLLPYSAYAGEVNMPVMVVISSPFHEMGVEEAYEYCQEENNEYCRYFEDGTLQVQEGDGLTVFEKLDDLGELENE